jgi:ESS family glutamate:Na+ symporter
MPSSLSFTLIDTLAIAAAGLLLGRFLVRSIPLLHRLCLPEPVMGGLLLCGLFTFLQSIGVAIQFDTSLQTPLMIAFFLSIGWMASLKNLKRGGPQVVKFLVVCSAVLLLQNLIGVGTARLLGQHPLLGLLAGSVSLTGGPGTALAFAPAFEQAGLASAGSIGTACALAGIILGGLLGSPMAALLMKRTGVRASPESPTTAHPQSQLKAMEASAGEATESSHLPQHLGFFVIVMALGALVGKWINSAGITLPIYIGSMIVAAVIRNVHDGNRTHRLSEEWIDQIGSVALSYFLVVATMTLQLHQLANLAGVLVIILAVQTVVVLAIATTLVFRTSGKDYDAAVMSGGFIGFMLGTTANALANMDGITSRHGSAPRAYLVVPLVGACFVDFVNALVITASIKFLS